MYSVIDVPIPSKQTKGEKKQKQKILQLAREGRQTHTVYKRSRIRGAVCPGPCTHLARAVCGFKPRLRLSYYWLIVIQYPRCPDPNLETSTIEV